MTLISVAGYSRLPKKEQVMFPIGMECCAGLRFLARRAQCPVGMMAGTQ